MTTNEIIAYVISTLSIIGSVFASSGFWTFVIQKNSKKTAMEKLILMDTEEKIVRRATEYIHRGSISRDEYYRLLMIYQPYKELGGNGTAEKIMLDISKLPIQTKRATENENKNS